MMRIEGMRIEGMRIVWMANNSQVAASEPERMIQERMNSPLEMREVRLRGLVRRGRMPCTGVAMWSTSRQSAQADFVWLLRRLQSLGWVAAPGMSRPGHELNTNTRPVAGLQPERMNSPLEDREVRLRGLPQRRPARVHGGEPCAGEASRSLRGFPQLLRRLQSLGPGADSLSPEVTS